MTEEWWQDYMKKQEINDSNIMFRNVRSFTYETGRSEGPKGRN
jgi:hypothetical protein